MLLTSGIHGDKPLKDNWVSSVCLCIYPIGCVILICAKLYFINISLELGDNPFGVVAVQLA